MRRFDSLFFEFGELNAGFGFIMPTNGGNELFFHSSTLLNANFSELQLGFLVTFEIGSNDKGPCAIDVDVEFS